MSKAWGHQQVWHLLRPILFWEGDTMKLMDKEIGSQNQCFGGKGSSKIFEKKLCFGKKPAVFYTKITYRIFCAFLCGVRVSSSHFVWRRFILATDTTENLFQRKSVYVPQKSAFPIEIDRNSDFVPWESDSFPCFQYNHKISS